MKNLGLCFLAALALGACNQAPAPEAVQEVAASTPDLAIIEDMPTIQQFSMEAVPDSDIEKIVNAGYNCPSAMNGQPWHFTVVTNAETIKSMKTAAEEGMKAMMAKMPKPEAKPEAKPDSAKADAKPEAKKGPHSGVGDSPLLIVISCKPGSELDAGLACQNMNAMANLLGYGTKVASSIQVITNGDKKAEYDKLFSVPEGMSVTTCLLVGKVDPTDYDAVSTATPRNDKASVVSYVK